jgi:hypothetical protein
MKKLAALLLSVVLCLSILPIQGLAAESQEASVTIEATADKETVQKGDTVTVSVTVSGSSYVGARCVLRFDGAKLSVESAPDGWDAIDGSTYYYFQVKSDTNSVWADGTKIGEFTFRAIAAGEADVTISDAYVATDWDSSGTSTPKIDCTAKSCSVTIVSAVAKEAVEYIAGYTMILVYTDGGEGYMYNGMFLQDVTASGYTYYGARFDHVYAYIFEGAHDWSNLVTVIRPWGTVVVYNPEEEVTLDQVQSVYNGQLTLSIPDVFRADLNRDKKVDISDTALLLPDTIDETEQA